MTKKTYYGIYKSNVYQNLTAKKIAEKRGFNDIVKVLRKKNIIEKSKYIYSISKGTLEVANAVNVL